MTPPVVIGTGHAGVAAAKKLVALGHRPLVVDAAETLEPWRQQVVDRLASVPPAAWEPEDVASVTTNPTVKDPMPRRLAFGSDYVYADRHEAVPVVRSSPSAPVPNLALGGFSNVWGAAMLPAADCDMTGWPFGRSELEPYYREVLTTLPLSAGHDELSEDFPTYVDEATHITAPPQAEHLLRKLSERARPRRDEGVVAGRARLAVRSRSDDPRSCSYCGHCLSGCVYGSISTATDELDQLRRSRSIEHLPGRVVRSISESDGRVQVHCDRLEGGSETIEADRVFLAAGAINSTRIVLESLGLWDTPVRLLSTQGFMVPLFQPSAPVGWPTVNTLAAIFVEYKVEPSNHWIHVQVNPPNELVQGRLGYRRGGSRAKDRVLAPAMERALVALANLHSDHAGHYLLTLRGAGHGPPVLRIEPASNPEFRRVARRAGMRLIAHLAHVGVLGGPPLLGGSDGPSGWHFGGSLPMSIRRTGRLDTDLAGRPAGWDRVHVVDSAVFPSIPATTIALLGMANATRIVDRAMRGDR